MKIKEGLRVKKLDTIDYVSCCVSYDIIDKIEGDYIYLKVNYGAMHISQFKKKWVAINGEKLV